MGMFCEKKSDWVCNIKQRIPDQEVDQIGPEERLWKRTVKHIT